VQTPKKQVAKGGKKKVGPQRKRYQISLSPGQNKREKNEETVVPRLEKRKGTLLEEKGQKTEKGKYV